MFVAPRRPGCLRRAILVEYGHWWSRFGSPGEADAAPRWAGLAGGQHERSHLASCLDDHGGRSACRHAQTTLTLHAEARKLDSSVVSLGPALWPALSNPADARVLRQWPNGCTMKFLPTINRCFCTQRSHSPIEADFDQDFDRSWPDQVYCGHSNIGFLTTGEDTTMPKK